MPGRKRDRLLKEVADNNAEGVGRGPAFGRMVSVSGVHRVGVDNWVDGKGSRAVA